MELESPILTTTRLLKAFSTQGTDSKLVNARLNLITYKGASGAWKLVKGTVAEQLPAISMLICNDKLWCEELLTDLDIPTPVTLLHRNFDESMAFMITNGVVVVKPRDASQGHGIQLNVTTEEQLFAAIQYAEEYSTDVLLQTQCEGVDIRVLVIDGTCVSTVERQPAFVVGDGKHTVAELILYQNLHNPERAVGGTTRMNLISDEAVKTFLSDEAARAVPAEGTTVRVVGPANVSLGGVVADGTTFLTEKVKQDAESIVRKLQMPIAGVDFIVSPEGHHLIEVNASPGINMHDDTYWNTVSDCFEQYAKWLYKNS